VLAVVCDGMGGHAAGDVASHIAIDTIVREWRILDDPADALQRALTLANRAIVSASQSNRELGGMGTTCVALILREGKAWCAHVGDSRCYLLRDGQLHRMTEDHSAVMEMVRRGEISEDEARTHPHRNVIRRALGSRSEVVATVWPSPLPLLPGDQFLLCSDGLHDVVTDDEMRRVLCEHPPRTACDLLVDLTRSRGAPDNVTVALVAIPISIDMPLRQGFEHVLPGPPEHECSAMPSQASEWH
jgi:PPM family protein phosphatase